MTRAMAALLRGHWRGAISANPLSIALIPFFIWFAGRQAKAVIFENRWAPVHAPVAGLALGLSILFGLIRNLPLHIWSL
jgi:hypothetical protein